KSIDQTCDVLRRASMSHASTVGAIVTLVNNKLLKCLLIITIKRHSAAPSVVYQTSTSGDDIFLINRRSLCGRPDRDSDIDPSPKRTAHGFIRMIRWRTSSLRIRQQVSSKNVSARHRVQSYPLEYDAGVSTAESFDV